ncbi:hypothetical protein SerAS12_1042 [Serratia sp. AS12]|uniref:hypothetical protein n=1 Tax=Serratia plymuthica TaxID=82996 RepID=UPI00020E9229|nr:hypothetical protein SerAS9_1042 [Serratia plymuthica AS9]AEF49145.1 hypothetical protein SerAS12_1042 [Serratia sp. AS12]AEG26853.1 hypothetical protein SerAS13_1042 [Serratia sp. AS13]
MRFVIEKSNHTKFMNLSLDEALNKKIVNLNALCRAFGIARSTVISRMEQGMDLATALTIEDQRIK